MISNRFDQVRALALRSRIVHWQLPAKLAAKKRPNKKKEKACIFYSDIVNYISISKGVTAYTLSTRAKP